MLTLLKKKNEDCLFILGEFGEELKYGLRIDLCNKLSKGKKINCIPSDIGLYVGITKDRMKQVRCDFCEEFVGQEHIQTFPCGREDAIRYICQSCDNTFSKLQKQAFVDHKMKRQ